MADLKLNLGQTQNVNMAVMQRMTLVGRVKMAQAIKLPESEWARMLTDVERDPLFQDLMNARAEGRRIVRYKRFGGTGLAGQFYEMQDADVVGTGGGQSPEALLDQKKHLLKLIEKVGQQNFEKFFLFREESDLPENIASICGITLDEVKQVQDFILDMSVQAEFYHPSHLGDPNNLKPTLIGRIIENTDKTYSMSFFSPHLARGMYTIDYDALRRWQKEKHLDRQSAARLRKFMGLLEISNLRQGAFWRVIDYVLKAQREYLATKDITKMAPVSLRKVAKHLQFAPSTISRVMAMKSVQLPWDHEVMLLHLMPGQRKVVLSILEKMTGSEDVHATDLALAKRMEEEFKVKVSRRTITACRHVLNGRQDKAA